MCLQRVRPSFLDCADMSTNLSGRNEGEGLVCPAMKSDMTNAASISPASHNQQVEHQSPMPVPAGELFAWHTRPGAVRRLMPPWDPAEIVEEASAIENGSRTTFRVKIGPFTKRWIAEHEAVEPPHRFSDRMVEGPFAAWRHTHEAVPRGPAASTLVDRITYRPPLGVLGRLLGGGLIRRKLERLFRYRHALTAGDLAMHQRIGAPPMRILVTGASGFVGTPLQAFLQTGGHHVECLRRPYSEGEASGPQWDPAAGILDPHVLEGYDAVIHLAGANIAGGRWTRKRKQLILDSRVDGTRLLASTLAAMRAPPPVLITASAIGFYGDRGSAVVDEAAAKGDGFLADVCEAWEAATYPAVQAGIRVAHMRFGIILSPEGGALGKMLLPFKLGVGGRLGSGRQVMSWVHMDDVLGAILHAVQNEGISGPVNVVAPDPVDNRTFTKALGKALGRWTVLPVPAFALRLLLGQMADEMLLSGADVKPSRLLDTGYAFRHPAIGPALRNLFGKDEPS